MSGWDAVRRVTLAEPWSDFWVEVYLDPPLGVYIDMRNRAADAVASPSEESIDALVRSMEPLIAAHNMVDREGAPLAFGIRTMGGRLIGALKDAIRSVQDDEGGATADPLTPTTSPSPSSRARRSRRSSASGS